MMDEISVLSVTGEMDGEQIRELRQAIERALERSCLNIILDFRGISHVHYSVWGRLLILIQEAKDRGGDLRIGSVNPYVSQIFHFVGLEKILPTYPSISEAIDSFNSTTWFYSTGLQQEARYE